jgi:hypothetical protein
MSPEARSRVMRSVRARAGISGGQSRLFKE